MSKDRKLIPTSFFLACSHVLQIPVPFKLCSFMASENTALLTTQPGPSGGTFSVPEGLTTAEALVRLKEDGTNTLDPPPKEGDLGDLTDFLSKGFAGCWNFFI